MSIWSVIYILGAGAMALPILNFMLRNVGDRDQVERGASIALTLGWIVLWPVALVIGVVLAMMERAR